MVQPPKMMPIATDEERMLNDRWVRLQTEVLMPLGRRGDSASLVAEAEKLLACEPSGRFRCLLIQGVAAVLQACGWWVESIAWYRRSVEETPQDPIARNSLAVAFFLNAQKEEAAGQLEQALVHSGRAVETSRASGRWRRFVLYDYCRIAAAAGRYDEVSKAMLEILDLWNHSSEPDIPVLEADWLNAVPADAIDPELIDRYRAAAERVARG